MALLFISVALVFDVSVADLGWSEPFLLLLPFSAIINNGTGSIYLEYWISRFWIV